MPVALNLAAANASSYSSGILVEANVTTPCNMLTILSRPLATISTPGISNTDVALVIVLSGTITAVPSVDIILFRRSSAVSYTIGDSSGNDNENVSFNLSPILPSSPCISETLGSMPPKPGIDTLPSGGVDASLTS
jgi:hypothetical protein